MSACLEVRWLAIAAVLSACIGCKNLYRYPSAENAVVDSQGRLWLAGSEGFAAVLDGRSLTRVDYVIPKELDEPFYRASRYGFATAHVVEVGGRVQIVTRAGHRFRYMGEGWERAPLDVGGSGPLSGQVNFAAAHEEMLLLYANDGRLVWVDPVSGKIIREEPLYGLVAPLATHEDVLVGIGHRGKARTLVQRVGKTKWKELVRFAEKVAVHALTRMGDRWLVVIDRGLVTVDDKGHARFIDGDFWVKAAEQNETKGALPEGTPITSTSRDDLETKFGEAFTAPGIVVIPKGDQLLVVSEGNWFTTGPCEGIRERPFPLPDKGPVARLRDGRMVAITASGKVYALGHDLCREVHPALVDW